MLRCKACDGTITQINGSLKETELCGNCMEVVEHMYDSDPRFMTSLFKMTPCDLQFESVLYNGIPDEEFDFLCCTNTANDKEDEQYGI